MLGNASACHGASALSYVIVTLGWGGEVDMWAVGILLYWMLSGHTPFEAPTISGIFVNIELGRYCCACIQK